MTLCIVHSYERVFQVLTGSDKIIISSGELAGEGVLNPRFFEVAKAIGRRTFERIYSCILNFSAFWWLIEPIRGIPSKVSNACEPKVWTHCGVELWLDFVATGRLHSKLSRD